MVPPSSSLQRKHDRLSAGAEEPPRPSAVIEFADERLRRDHPEGVFDDVSDLIPINAVVAIGVEEDAEPVGEHARCRRHWMDEPVWFARRQAGRHARRGGTPQRDPPVAAMVVVEVAERSLALRIGLNEGILETPTAAEVGQCRLHTERRPRTRPGPDTIG